MITSAADVVELGTILGIWAHPDDEAYLSAGVMAMARDHGQRVVCVTATRGELGTADPLAWPPDRLAAERTQELARCLEILGVHEHHWLGYHDGECAGAAQAVARLGALIDEVRPDTVLTFGPDGITGHPDHQAVSAWTGAAVDRAAPRGTRLLHATIPQRYQEQWGALNDSLGIYPPGYRPVCTPSERLAIDMVLPPETAARKVRALAAQTTQTAGLITALGTEVYTAWVEDEAYVEVARRPSSTARRPSSTARRPSSTARTVVGATVPH